MKDDIAPRREELDAADAWWNAHFGETAAVWPFSFMLDGQRVRGPTPDWTCEWRDRPLDDRREERVLTAMHAGSGLEVRCVAVRYRDFPALEWTAHLRQTDAGAGPLVSDLQGLDAEWRHGEKTDYLLRSYRGDDHEQRHIYEPSLTNLWAGRRMDFAPTSWSGNAPEGRCSSGAFPYFAVEEAGFGEYGARPVARGMLVAIGWPGRWKAEFERDAGAGLRVRAGQEGTRFRLTAGESFRAPLIALLFFEGGDRVRAQNLWRRWMIAHNMPRPGGKLPPPMLEASTCGFFDEMGRADEANQIEYIDRHRAAGIPITHWWMDAGWYPCHVEDRKKNCWWVTGTWEVDRGRFPHGLRAIADHAHRHGISTIVWFEPERAAPGTWLARERLRWLLYRASAKAADGKPNSWANFQLQNENGILDLGNPEALAWLIERVCQLVAGEGIDVYRQDFNINPLPLWRANDGPERQGMAENRHTCGYLAYWDALRDRFPAMLLDSCASGGRRNDLETMRRSVTLHPTDHRYDDLPVKQCLRHTLFQWLPFFGGPVLPLERVDACAFRSTMGLSTVVGYDLRKEHDLDLLRKLAGEWHEVSACYYGDFYPLTEYSRADDAWMAWQFHRHEQDDGLIQVFRRTGSPLESACFPLQGLDSAAEYVFHDYDVPGDTVHRGADLAAGWRIHIPERRTARVIRYRRG